jgi:hypothetical protein
MVLAVEGSGAAGGFDRVVGKRVNRRGGGRC